MTANENQIVVYQPNETVRLDVRLENETVWLTQKLIVIDAYPGVATLDMLAKRGRGVKIELVTHWEIGGYLSAKIKYDGWGKLSSQWLDKFLVCQMCSRRLHRSFQCQMFSH